ncbi:MAG: hypothetical protein ACXWBQ_13565, partial [Usitatibacter sp.]
MADFMACPDGMQCRHCKGGACPAAGITSANDPGTAIETMAPTMRIAQVGYGEVGGIFAAALA